MFTAYMNNSYTTKSQYGIQILIDTLLGIICLEELIVMMAHTQHVNISNMPVPNHSTNISSPEDMSSIMESPKAQGSDTYYMVIPIPTTISSPEDNSSIL